jgi:SEC-C motif-containing protein
MAAMIEVTQCPCGSGEKLDDCCGHYMDHGGAPTCETLMRSRYSAYVLDQQDYLRQTWHPDTCPEQFGGTSLTWIDLEIVSTEKGLENDQDGVVEFIASFCDSTKGRKLHETSRFGRLKTEEGDSLWVYLDGKCSVSDIGRNDPCPCSSGKKFKKCCGSAGRGEV